MINPRQGRARVIRILSSERCEDFCEVWSAFVHEAAGDGISVATLIPPTVHEIDLLEKAAEQRWDMVMLLLNNIRYSSDDRSASGIIRDAGNLIRKMKQLFNKPILCFYGWPNDPEIIKVAIQAGADAIFPLPCKGADVLPTLRRCLAGKKTE